MEIIPAIIPENYEDLEEKLRAVKGFAPLVQIDVTDGKFVPEKCWPFTNAPAREEFDQVVRGEVGLPYWKDFDFEVDLMVESPEENIEDWVAAGFSRLIIHFESTNNLSQIIDDLKERVEIGLALEIDTPNEKIAEFVSQVDFIQCMGIAEIGFQGQSFDERVIPKIKYFKQTDPDVIISVDGGVDFESARKLKIAGVDRLVSGSTIFEAEDVEGAYRELRNL